MPTSDVPKRIDFRSLVLVMESGWLYSISIAAIVSSMDCGTCSFSLSISFTYLATSLMVLSWVIRSLDGRPKAVRMVFSTAS